MSLSDLAPPKLFSAIGRRLNHLDQNQIKSYLHFEDRIWWDCYDKRHPALLSREEYDFISAVIRDHCDVSGGDLGHVDVRATSGQFDLKYKIQLAIRNIASIIQIILRSLHPL